jgi:hypothetical protein
MILLLVDSPLSTTHLHRLSDHFAVTVVQKDDSDSFISSLPHSDIIIINISKWWGISFYELNYDKNIDIVYFMRDESAIVNPDDIGYDYILTRFPQESKTADEMRRRLFINQKIIINTKCNACCDFILNKITCKGLCSSLFKCSFACT